MISRRRFLSALPAASVCSLGAAGGVPGAGAEDGTGGSSARATKAVGSHPVSQNVKLRIGTGGHGHTYPGATVPFGMVQLSPDTYNDDWDWSSGYHASDESLMGFSHTHLSGTGIGDMLDVLVMPGTGWEHTMPSSRDTPERGYRSRFSHDDEIAAPGYYSVVLRDYRIRAELSATTRAGIHRYTFPKSDRSHFIVDFAHAYHQDEKNRAAMWAKLKIIGNDTIVGARGVHRWAREREIYFAMKFSKPFARAEIVAGGTRLEPAQKESDNRTIKCLLHYATGDGEAILVKTGISGVSIEGAMANLEVEIPGWDFEKVRAEAADAWERELSRVEIEGGSEKQRQIFYTSLYHTLVAPTIFDDVDGRYRGMDGKVHTLKQGEHNYSTFSLWDTYRAAHPLYTLVQPDRVPSMVNCLIRMAHESPAGLPIWPLQAKETFCMTGYHSVVVIAEAVNKGFPGLEAQSAYEAMRRRVMDEDYRGLALYRKYGYIPADLQDESIGRGMDYAYDDWAVAQVARALGHTDDANLLVKRARNYKNFYDPRVRFMRPRLANGEFAEPFVPSQTRYSKAWPDYTESNAWQATFAVQHDPKGLAELMGGPAQLVMKLDELFHADPTLPENAAKDIAGLVGQYAHGNEPSHHIAYLYVYGGAPYKTQERVADLLDRMYDNQPDGLAGNEDCGQMSAWYCMSAMGFYPVDPVSGIYVLGTPLFDRVTIYAAGGRPFLVEAKRSSPEAIYIESATLNGKALDRAWFRHRDVVEGGRLVLQLSAMPNREFGSRPGDAPPSMTG